MEKNQIKRMWLFLAVVFGISWILALVYWIAGGNTNTASASYMIMAIAYMFTPMIAAILVQKVILKQKMKDIPGITFKLNKWWIAAWLSPLFIAISTMGIALMFPDIEFSSEMEGMFDRFEGIIPPEQMEELRNVELPIHPFFITILQGLVAALTINAVAGFGEELGWRGLLHETLKSKGFWKMSVIIGLIWGVWHAPIILMGHNYPEYPLIGVFMMIAFCVLFAPLFTLIREKSNSVIAVSIFHGGINALGGTAYMLLKGGNELLLGLTGLSGFIVLALINFFIFIYVKNNKIMLNEN